MAIYGLAVAKIVIPRVVAAIQVVGVASFNGCCDCAQHDMREERLRSYEPESSASTANAEMVLILAKIGANPA